MADECDLDSFVPELPDNRRDTQVAGIRINQSYGMPLVDQGAGQGK